MAKYIKCYHCGKKIPFGEVAYHFEYSDVYCSTECYCAENASVMTVDDYSVNECDCTVYDDDARREEIRREMEEHRMAMEKLFEELKTLTAQN